MNSIKLFIKGMLVGIANVIPGVSGGTIAVVLNIFDMLIEAVNNIFKDFMKYLKFLMPLGLGAVTGIFLFSRLVEYCLMNYSLPTNLFFVGLVAGSLPLIFRESKKEGKTNAIAFLAALALVLGIAYLKPSESAHIISEFTPKNGIMFVLVGTLASAAMVMPGVSGSFVLVLIGYYNSFISAISNFNIPIIMCIGIGVVLGIVLISKIIDTLLKKAYGITYSGILGLITGSLIAILTDKATYQTGLSPLAIGIGVLLAIAGFVVALKLGD